MAAGTTRLPISSEEQGLGRIRCGIHRLIQMFFRAGTIEKKAKVATAQSDLYVSYTDGLNNVPKGSNYYFDDLMRILPGWHGTFDPPCGMGAELMISMSSSVRNSDIER